MEFKLYHDNVSSDAANRMMLHLLFRNSTVKFLEQIYIYVIEQPLSSPDLSMHEFYYFLI